MSYTKVVVTGHVIEIYRMEKEPVDPHEYINKWKDEKEDFWAGFRNDGTMSEKHLEEWHTERKKKWIEEQREKRDRKEERRAQTLRDGRNRCRRYAIANFVPEDCFITLTYRYHIEDVKQADSDFKAFIRRFRKYTGIKLKYLAVREFTKKGRIHFHFVTDWKHPARHVDDEEYIKRLERIVADIWGHGFIDIKPMNKAKTHNKKYNGKPIDNIGAYLTKYMTKDLQDERLIKNKSYLNSQGLIKPTEYTGESAEEIIKFYNLEKEKEIFTNSYESEYLGTITYEEYNLKRLEKQEEICFT